METHFNINCRYEQIKGKIGDKDCFCLYRHCECSKFKSVDRSEVHEIEKDGLSVHFNKNCSFVKQEHPSNKFVLTQNCLCRKM